MPCLSFEQTLRTLSGIFFPTHVVAGSFRRAPLKRLARFLDAAPHGLASAVAPSRTHLHPCRARGTRAQPPRTPAVRKTFGPKRQPHALLPTLDPPSRGGSRTARPLRARVGAGDEGTGQPWGWFLPVPPPCVPNAGAPAAPGRSARCGPRPPRASGLAPPPRRSG